jgi:hypothetical protein
MLHFTIARMKTETEFMQVQMKVPEDRFQAQVHQSTSPPDPVLLIKAALNSVRNQVRFFEK